jgi:hypothetical protein
LFSALILFGSSAVRADYYDYRDGQRYLCTADPEDGGGDNTPQCSDTVLRTSYQLNQGDCQGMTPWACYQDVLTTCTDSQGHITQNTQTVQTQCAASFTDCN